MEGHHFTAGALGLTFLPVFLGGCIAVTLVNDALMVVSASTHHFFTLFQYLTIFNPRYERAMEKYKPNPVPPEVRLELAIFGAPLFAIAFFWFGWTSYPSISFWAPMLSGLAMGISVNFIFVSGTNWIRF